MGGGRVARIELGVDAGAALLLAAAVAFAAWRLLGAPELAAASAAISCVGSLLALRRVQPAEPCFAVEQFDVPALERAEPEELVLTDCDRLDPVDAMTQVEELVLDPNLAHFGPGSRVVRLFDAAAMPTPAELKARIDRHGGRGPEAPLADASQALYDALAELRRALR